MSPLSHGTNGTHDSYVARRVQDSVLKEAALERGGKAESSALVMRSQSCAFANEKASEVVTPYAHLVNVG